MEINVNKTWFDFIKKGKKVIEGRLNKGKFQKLKKNEIIYFANGVDKIKVKIMDIIRYNTFEEYLLQEGLKRTLPGIQTLKDGVNVYYSFYTKEQEKEFGILAVRIKRIE